MQSLRPEGQSGLYLAWLQGYGGGGGTGFLGWVVREGQVGRGEKSIKRREIKSRLMSGVEIRGKEGEN